MKLRENSAPSTPNVSSKLRNIFERFAPFSEATFSADEYVSPLTYERSPREEQWLAREDARWLIIRNTLKGCGVNASVVSRLMAVQGVCEHHHLSDLLNYIATGWDPKTSIEICDIQWLAGWDIEFCRATGDWTLVHFTLGLLRQAAEFHGQLPKAQERSLDVIRRYRGVQSRVAERLGVSHSVVARVARGITKSARISAALAEELALIESSCQGQADGALRVANAETKPLAAAHESIQGAEHSRTAGNSKPRVRLRFYDDFHGDVWAHVGSGNQVVQIGRRSVEAA